MAAFHALIERLQDEAIRIAIDNQRRQEIGLGVDQPVGGGISHNFPAEGLGGGDARGEIDFLRSAAQHPQRDLGRGGVMGLAEKPAAGIQNVDDFPRRRRPPSETISERKIQGCPLASRSAPLRLICTGVM